jgi:hypothetical protein
MQFRTLSIKIDKSSDLEEVLPELANMRIIDNFLLYNWIPWALHTQDIQEEYARKEGPVSGQCREYRRLKRKVFYLLCPKSNS